MYSISLAFETDNQDIIFQTAPKAVVHYPKGLSGCVFAHRRTRSAMKSKSAAAQCSLSERQTASAFPLNLFSHWLQYLQSDAKQIRTKHIISKQFERIGHHLYQKEEKMRKKHVDLDKIKFARYSLCQILINAVRYTDIIQKIIFKIQPKYTRYTFKNAILISLRAPCAETPKVFRSAGR